MGKQFFFCFSRFSTVRARVAAACVTKSRYSPSAQRLPKACSDTPRMDTRICVSISDWLVSYALCDRSYSCEISKNKYRRVYVVFFCTKPGNYLRLKRSDSSVYRNLCCRVIEKRNERVLLSKGWKQFDVATEIESLEISLRSTENKYICRDCVAKLKKTSITYRAIRKIGSRTEKP